MFDVGNIIACKDSKIYIVARLASRTLALVDLTTYEILFPYDIETYINATHQGIRKVYEHYTDYVANC